MKKVKIFLSLILACSLCADAVSQSSQQSKIILSNNWTIQSSAVAGSDGKTISSSGFQPEKWYPAKVPSTVFGTLVENKVYPDPYFGTNIESVPGYMTRRDNMPDNSPFKVAWWYRTVFKVPAEYKSMVTWLKLHSINYRANIWLNGNLVSDTTVIEGAYRLFKLDITKYAKPGEMNCLAFEIFPPKGTDLTITWVDWNPTPPDRGMGIWYDMMVEATGPVAIENTRVITKLNLPTADKAKLTITTELRNTKPDKVTGILSGKIDNITFSQEITLAPNENRLVELGPDKFAQLEMSNPKLWWPYTMGAQNLYNLSMTFETGGKISDSDKVRFGVREVTSWMNKFDGKQTRVFQINGKNLVIRGGGYVEDMMMRPSDKRIDTDISYAKFMGLNALRMEAPRGPDYIFDKCDEEGILLMVGWCCCSSWERWKNWTPHVTEVAEKSWTDQIVRLRNHPAVFDWLYGSDNFPPVNVEKIYIQVLNDYDGTRPYQSSATADSSAIAGRTGLYMGPYPKVYAYMPPSYWYGKLEFNTEAGPSGEQIPPVESMRKMMPEKDLWPISNSWNIRLHKAFFPSAREALNTRYGTPAGVEEYSMKSQVLQYEATRAMFEAFAGNKYRSSGIIYWMYNSAWPKMYWQFYDYFFTPNGSFYGARKACETLHIQYAYNDGSVMVVNGFFKDYPNLKATASIYSLNMEEKYSKEITVSVAPDEAKKLSFPEWPKNLPGVTFLKLILRDSKGKELSSNFYWLSDKGDEKADFTSLSSLPVITLKSSVIKHKVDKGMNEVTVQIENPTSSLAFAINPKILRNKTRDLVTPVYWDDNYFSLLPKEKRIIKVVFADEDLHGEGPLVQIVGWNVKPWEF